MLKITTNMTSGEILCVDSDFEQITVTAQDGSEVILVKVDAVLHGYRNSCPHVGIGLDYGDGNCLTDEKDLICSMHGARFEAASGYCTAGPCSGQSLQRLSVGIEKAVGIEKESEKGNIVLYET